MFPCMMSSISSGQFAFIDKLYQTRRAAIVKIVRRPTSLCALVNDRLERLSHRVRCIEVEDVKQKQVFAHETRRMSECKSVFLSRGCVGFLWKNSIVELLLFFSQLTALSFVDSTVYAMIERTCRD